MRSCCLRFGVPDKIGIQLRFLADSEPRKLYSQVLEAVVVFDLADSLDSCNERPGFSC